MARILLDSLSVAVVGEYESEILIEELNAMKAIVDLINIEFLTADEVNRISGQVLKILEESHTRKIGTEAIL